MAGCTESSFPDKIQLWNSDLSRIPDSASTFLDRCHGAGETRHVSGVRRDHVSISVPTARI